MYIHNDAKNFQCVKCGDAFKQKATLYNHMKRHKNEKDIGVQLQDPKQQNSADINTVQQTIPNIPSYNLSQLGYWGP